MFSCLSLWRCTYKISRVFSFHTLYRGTEVFFQVRNAIFFFLFENTTFQRSKTFDVTPSVGMSKKRPRREKDAPTTLPGEPRDDDDEEPDDNGTTTTPPVWRMVTEHPDIFDTHVVTKLNGNEVKFFYDVNTESRAAIQRSGAQLRDAFRIRDFDTKSTVSWALEKCSEKKERFCWRMAEKGNLELLKVLHEKGCPCWDETTCSKAAENGHLECLKYAHENGCPWNKSTCHLAAFNGHLECLKYAHEKGCPWNEKTCKYAAYYGHLECLKYAHENGCPWSKYTCQLPASNGHLECLKYAHENGCPWDERTCRSAARYGHLECLEYARENWCPFDEEASALDWHSE